MTSIKPFVDQYFNGQIWRFIIDEKAGLLAAEIRATDNKEVSFASLDVNNGKVYFKDLILPERWLSGLSGIFDGVDFLHGYQSAQSPAHKGITAIDGFTGAELWSNYNYALNFVSVNGPIAYNTQLQPVKLFLLDAKTGATLRPFNASIDIQITVSIKVPDILTNTPAEFNSFFGGEVTGNCHYIQYNSFRIVSLHTLKDGQLQQQLIIVFNGDVIYRDILTDKIQKLQPEAFILYQNQLMYIKNASELKILNL